MATVKSPLIEPIEEFTTEAVAWLQRKANKAMKGKNYKPIPSPLKKRRMARQKKRGGK
jgi:hypothetical protein